MLLPDYRSADVPARCRCRRMTTHEPDSPVLLFGSSGLIGIGHSTSQSTPSFEQRRGPTVSRRSGHPVERRNHRGLADNGCCEGIGLAFTPRSSQPEQPSNHCHIEYRCRDSDQCRYRRSAWYGHRRQSGEGDRQGDRGMPFGGMAVLVGDDSRNHSSRSRFKPLIDEQQVEPDQRSKTREPGRRPDDNCTRQVKAWPTPEAMSPSGLQRCVDNRGEFVGQGSAPPKPTPKSTVAGRI